MSSTAVLKRIQGGRAIRRWWVVLPIGATLLIASPAAASTGTFASNGERCTIVGTAKVDVLKGTAGKDVICGRGGDDTIRGVGGNDVIDGGSGRDDLSGGSGNDRVYGGKGSDEQSGNDGRDVLIGGDGADVLLGGDDPDSLRGQDGDDDLDGDAGGDNLDGGEDTNWCTLSAADVQNRCVYDRTVPVVHEVTAKPGTVDVSDRAKTFTMRAHVTDDTGVDWLNLSTDAGDIGRSTLVSGDVRDGWWEAEVTVGRYTRPGTWGVYASVQDRIGRQDFRPATDFVTVRNSSPDTRAPVVVDLDLSHAKVDVRTGDAKVKITARVTDDRSGAVVPYVALFSPFNSYSSEAIQMPLDRVSGTDRDGKYYAEVVVPRGSTGGAWNVGLSVIDNVDNVARFVGPDMYAAKQHETYNNYVPLPSGVGRLDVLGVVPDTSRPVLHDVVVSRTEIDTLPRSATVTFDITASDVGDGIKQVTVAAGDEFDVVAVADGEAALAAARANPPDLLLADVMMPGVDGFGLLAAIRADADLANLPVILLSARAGQEASADGLAAGADDYIVKPFSGHDLISRLRANLERARARTRDLAWRTAMLASTTEGVVIADVDAVQLDMNDAWAQLTGYGPEGLPYAPPYPWWPSAEADPEGRAMLEAAMAQVQSQSFGRFEVPFQHRDGHRIWVSITMAPVIDPSGGPALITATARDITRERSFRGRRDAATRLSAALVDCLDLADLQAAVVHGFAEVFEGVAYLFQDGPHVRPELVITRVGTGSAREIPESVREAACAARLAPDDPPADTAVPGLLLSAALPEHPHAVWVHFAVPRRVTTDERALAAILADMLATALDRCIRETGHLHTEEHLRQALAGERMVAHAVGILIERHRLTHQAAFDRLRVASNERNLKMRDLAERLVRTGEEPDAALIRPQRRQAARIAPENAELAAAP